MELSKLYSELCKLRSRAHDMKKVVLSARREQETKSVVYGRIYLVNYFNDSTHDSTLNAMFVVLAQDEKAEQISFKYLSKRFIWVRKLGLQGHIIASIICISPLHHVCFVSGIEFIANCVIAFNILSSFCHVFIFWRKPLLVWPTFDIIPGRPIF